jgi:hypothetical protein
MNHVIALRLAAVAGLSLLLSGRITQVQHARREAAEPHGRFTLDQILECSIPLCGALTKNTDSLRLTGSPLLSWTMGKAEPIWLVDAVDAHDRFKVHLMWDADTGELITASCPADSSTRANKTTLLQRKDARRITSSWLTTLGMSELATGWRPDSLPHNTNYMWRVEWRTRTRGAAVVIDSHTGQLIMAETIKPADKVVHYRIAQGAANREMKAIPFAPGHRAIQACSKSIPGRS